MSIGYAVRRVGAPATSDSVAHGRPDLPSLTGLRFIAAGLVFLFHVAGWGVAATPWWHLAQFGFIGVAFFFVLSGVVLTWSARPRTSARKFWHRRAARIYPAHVVTCLVAIGLYVFVMPPHKPVWAGLVALLLLQAWPPVSEVGSAANGVSWSLSCEAFFYALFPWLMPMLARRGQRGRWLAVGGALVACSTAAMAFSLAWGGRFDTPAYMNPLVRAGEFVLGVGLGLALRDGWIPRVRLTVAWSAVAAAAGCALLAGVLWGWPVPRGFADVVAIGPLALVLMAYAGRDLIGRRTWLSSQWAVYLGQLSFAFYLVHQLVLDLVLKRILPMDTPSQPALLLGAAVALAMSVVAAMAVHHLVELPAQQLLTRRHTGAPAVVSLPAAYPTEPEVAGDRFASVR
jgi:peptidoglycan/LPS O-acetylase OafA/YrhL